MLGDDRSIGVGAVWEFGEGSGGGVGSGGAGHLLVESGAIKKEVFR